MIHQSHAGAVPKYPAAIPKGWKLAALAVASWALVIVIGYVLWITVRAVAGH